MRLLVVVFSLLVPLFACAQDSKSAPQYKEGEHYTVIAGQPKPDKSGPIEVTELFWYGCGHCYRFEPMLEEWAKTLPEGVEFNRSPAMWQQGRPPQDRMWTHARLYYTAKAMGELDKLHPLFFEAMHRNNRELVDSSEIAGVVSQAKVDGMAFVKTMDSFAVNAQVEQADSRQRAYKITGTPEMVVDGYYHVSARSAGSQQAMLEVVDFLVKKLRSER